MQVLAHEATLNFSLDETISAMMIRSAGAVQSTSNTALPDKAASLLGTLLLASDVTGPCDEGHDRHHTGFRLVEEREERFQRACEILETHVGRKVRIVHARELWPLPLRTFVSVISCWVQQPLTQNVHITETAQKTEPSPIATSARTFSILTQVRQQQEGHGSASRLEFPCKHRTLFHVGTNGAGSRSVDSP